METREPRIPSSEEAPERDHSRISRHITVFETEAWIPVWEQSTPGKDLVLDSVPTSCYIDLETEPYFAIEINLEGEEAINHFRIMMQQGEQIPMQFRGLDYGDYPIRWNNYVTCTVRNDTMHIHAKCRLMGNGLRTLRKSDSPLAEALGFVINLAIDNYRPLTLNLNDWIVILSPQLRRGDDESNFIITHELKITNRGGYFSDAALEEFRDKLRIVFSVINLQCCDIVLTQGLDIQSSLSCYMIDQIHCDPFNSDVLQYTEWSAQLDEEVNDIASKLYVQVQTCEAQYLEALEMLACSHYQSIPSLWTILEKTCGSGPSNIRAALQHCVDSIRVPSEYSFLLNELKVGENADFIDVFYGMRNHYAHEKTKIARGRLIPPETLTTVKRLAQLLCWSKVLTDTDVKCLIWQEARVSFADWEFEQHEGQPTILSKFQTDGTYDHLAAMRRLLRGGETPGRTSAYFETAEGNVMFCEATDWPKEMPHK